MADDRAADDRPEPKYGQYAPVPPVQPVVEPAPVAVELPAEAAVRPRRTWDVVLTTLLLLIGVFDVVTSYGTFVNLGEALKVVYQQQGFGEFTSLALASQLGVVINVVRIVLLVVAMAVSLVRIGQNRVTFWAPLGAGVLAFIVMSACIIALAISDPALAEYVRSTQP